MRSKLLSLLKNVDPKKCVAYGVILGTSAVTQDRVVAPLASGANAAPRDFDASFPARCFVLGTCWLGPAVMVYQGFAERTFPGVAWRAVAKKISLDQLTLGPFMISSFFLGINLLEGAGWRGAVEEWRRKFLVAYVVGLCFWPLANTVLWRAVPPGVRPVWHATMALVWGNVLCFLKNRSVEADGKQG